MTCIEGNICSNLSKPHVYETCLLDVVCSPDELELELELDFSGNNQSSVTLNGSDYFERNIYRRSLQEVDLIYMDDENTTSYSDDLTKELIESLNETTVEISEYEWQVGSFGPV